LVYVAPERLANGAFVDRLARSNVALVAVDEAHCIVQWGHDFRPDYLRIGALLERLAPARVLACTATATPDARAEIMRQLRFAPAETKVILRGFARPNLHLSVEEVSGPREAVLRTEAALRAALGSPRAPSGAGIVYAATRRRAEEIAAELVHVGFDAKAYHAGMPTEERTAISNAFAARELSVVVATNAFGMGIDRPDVRVVVHAQPPSSIEAYYQEVGRAGRDGAPASGLLLHAAIDIAVRRRLCFGDGTEEAGGEGARAWALFRELLRYVDASTCRHDFILRHFGDEAESLGGCGHCDVCLSATQSEDGEARAAADLDVVRRALAGVARARARVGMQAVAAMLVGDASPRVTKSGLDKLSTFGVLRGRSVDEAMTLLRVLLANGWIDLTPGEYPMPQITKAGWEVMRGDVTPRIALPSRAEPGAKKRAGKRSRAQSTASAPTSAASASLLDALRAERLSIAREHGVPAYVVAPNRTLDEIASLRPRTLAELARVHGMGPSRIEAYGEAFLAIVRSA
ncbi:MAG TPA: ATP-dependent DNA helicase RecQ, partial [Minicystis sp.]|nr:ATP-dependent DNA helicase RecQ [Minicystis sp.]